MHQRRRLLLLVDGDVQRAEKLGQRLAHLQYDVHIADNGATGLLKTHEARPDVVIAAAELPILDGCRMLEAMRSKPQTAEIPVILLMETHSQEEMARGWRAGADLCIPRTEEEAEVMAILHRALGSIPIAEHAPRKFTLVS